MQYNGVKVFSATKAKEREGLGEVITRWIRENPDNEVIETRTLQSSDNEFHCLTIIVFFKS